MLDVKKLITKILKRIATKSVTVTGTTNGNGALYLSTIPPNANIVCIQSSSSDHLAIPFYYSNNTWYAKVVSWRTLANVNSTSVTLTVRYWGGYFITYLLSTLVRGWRYVRHQGIAYQNAHTARCSSSGAYDSYKYVSVKRLVKQHHQVSDKSWLLSAWSYRLEAGKRQWLWWLLRTASCFAHIICFCRFSYGRLRLSCGGWQCQQLHSLRDYSLAETIATERGCIAC